MAQIIFIGKKRIYKRPSLNSSTNINEWTSPAHLSGTLTATNPAAAIVPHSKIMT